MALQRAFDSVTLSASQPIEEAFDLFLAGHYLLGSLAYLHIGSQ